MKFGGGFYGVTAFITWIYIELGEAVSFILNFSGFAELFKDGIGSFLIDLMVNQFQNFITAMIWFTYWADGERSILVWVVVPYLAYLAGLFAAGKSVPELKLAFQNLLQKR